MKSLKERVTDFYEYQCLKHDLNPCVSDYVEEQLELMTREEFLSSISDAVDEMFEEFALYGTMAKDVRYK